MLDYHHHSAFSVDSIAPMGDVCARALARGIDEIAFTEHMDFIPEERNTGYFRYDAYMEGIRACRERFAGVLTIVAGIEVDYCPDFENEIAKWLEGKDFDFVIGSVHYLRGKGNISEPRATDYFDGKNEQDAYGEYFGVVLRCARSGLWDALGHIDLIKRYGTSVFGPFNYRRHLDVIDEILGAVVEERMALEINASGLRQPPGECYPSVDLLRRYREIGGERVTIGSDSHSVEHVGDGVPTAIAAAVEAGFTEVLSFRKRLAVPVPIARMDI